MVATKATIARKVVNGKRAGSNDAAAILADALDAIEECARPDMRGDTVTIRRTAEICDSSLRTLTALGSEVGAPQAVRAAALFARADFLPPALSTHMINRIREAACAAVGSFSPDVLFTLWARLGGPDPVARHILLPVLDYIRDPRAIPYLKRILSRCVSWPDGELTAWFVVRTLERIGDRSSLSCLRSFAAQWNEFCGEPDDHSRRQLAIELARVIESLDRRAMRRDNRSLLRPARIGAESLLRTTNDCTRNAADRMELVRVGPGS